MGLLGMFGGGSNPALDQSKKQGAYDFSTQQQQMGKWDKDISQFEGVGGDPTKSSFYNRMLTTGLDQTASAYNNVRASRAAQARRSGFGYASPQAGVSETELNAEQARSEGEMANQVGLQAYDRLMEAGKQRGGMAETMGGQATSNTANMNQAWQTQQQATGGLFSRIANLGLKAAGVAFPGFGAATKTLSW